MARLRVDLSEARYALQVGDDGYIVRVYPSGYIRLHHRAIAEEVLGRKLKIWEVVHHVDGDRQNYKKSNLLICTESYHRELHQRCLSKFGTWHLYRDGLSSDQQRTPRLREGSFYQLGIGNSTHRSDGSSPLPRRKKT